MRNVVLLLALNTNGFLSSVLVDYHTPPPYEKLVGELAGAYSRRINILQRLAYQVLEGTREVKVLRMWTHYE